MSYQDWTQAFPHGHTAPLYYWIVYGDPSDGEDPQPAQFARFDGVWHYLKHGDGWEPWRRGGLYWRSRAPLAPPSAKRARAKRGKR